MKKLFALLMAGLTAVGLLGCSEPAVLEGELVPIELAPGEELYCYAESKEQAEEIAEAYGIELVHFGNSIAAFHTEEDPFEVIRRGEKEGLPTLSPNMVNHVDDGENLNSGERKYPKKEKASGE